jgi:hypothetical protein
LQLVLALLIKAKSHFKKEGLQEIINLRASMNRGLTLILKESFPNTLPVQRPSILLEEYSAD